MDITIKTIPSLFTEGTIVFFTNGQNRREKCRNSVPMEKYRWRIQRLAGLKGIPRSCIVNNWRQDNLAVVVSAAKLQMNE